MSLRGLDFKTLLLGALGLGLPKRQIAMLGSCFSLRWTCAVLSERTNHAQGTANEPANQSNMRDMALLLLPIFIHDGDSLVRCVLAVFTACLLA